MTVVEEQGSALAIRESSGAALVKPVPMPAQLQELGVRIAEDEGGLRVIVLPPAVRQAVNLLTPISSWNQADPNWTPSIALVQLDKDSHTYPLPGGKLGLNKQALETLGKCAGVLYTRTSRVPSSELQPGEDYAYRATVGFRRSDGTVDEVTRERGFNREAEQADIEEAVAKKVARGSEAYATEVKKRWIAELRFGPSKTESKAINRALRAGLSMPASVSAGALEKPFLVVGFNFTPDYNDPEQKAALIQIAHLRSDQIYGGREVSDQAPELAAGDIPAGAIPVTGSVDAPAEEESAAAAAPLDEQAGDGGAAAPVAGSSSDGAEPTLEAEPQLAPEPDAKAPLRMPESVVQAAAQTVMTLNGRDGAVSQKTLDEILALGDSGALWINWALAHLEDGEERAALEIVVQHRAPELWAAHVGGSEAS